MEGRNSGCVARAPDRNRLIDKKDASFRVSVRDTRID